MQKLVKFIELCKTRLAIDEEEIQQLEKQIDSYTYVGDEQDDQDKQVSDFVGEAKCISQHETEHYLDQEEHHDEKKSDHGLTLNEATSSHLINAKIPRIFLTSSSPTNKSAERDTQIKSVQVKNLSGCDHISSSYDDFFGPRFGLYDQIRKTLERQRRQEFQDFIVHKTQNEPVKRNTKSKIGLKAPLRPSGFRKNLFQPNPNLSASSPAKSRSPSASSPTHDRTENTFIHKLIDGDTGRKGSVDSQARYKEELLQQIKEKQKYQAELREKERIAEEKLNRQVAEERRRMRIEYENEIQRIKRASLSQPNLTSLGKPTSTPKTRDAKSPSYPHLREVALSRRSKSPSQAPSSSINTNEITDGTKGKKITSNNQITEINGSRGRKLTSNGTKMRELPAEVTLNSSEAIRKVIPLIPNVKKNIADQQHRLFIKLAGIKKQPSPLPVKRITMKNMS